MQYMMVAKSIGLHVLPIMVKGHSYRTLSRVDTMIPPTVTVHALNPER